MRRREESTRKTRKIGCADLCGRKIETVRHIIEECIEIEGKGEPVEKVLKEDGSGIKKLKRIDDQRRKKMREREERAAQIELLTA